MATEHLRESMSTLDALAEAIERNARAGSLPPCAVAGDMWVSEDPADRAYAAAACHRGPCPVLAPCAAAAVSCGATWGVWGGRDLFVRPKQQRRRGGTSA